MARLIRHPAVERGLLSFKTVTDWVVAKLVGLILHWVKKLPPQKSIKFMRRAGRFLAPVLPRTSMARKNIALAFPEKSKAEVDEIVRAM